MSRKKAIPQKTVESKGNAAKPTADNGRDTKSDSAGKSKRRWRSGTVALREIKKEQSTSDAAIPLAPFRRLVKDIDRGLGGDVHRFKPEAVLAIRSAAEAYIADVFKKGMAISVNGKSVTLKIADVMCALEVMRA